MKDVRQFDALERVSLPPGPVQLAIGMFDGVHRGHQAVIRAAADAARSRNGLAGVLTFWPHPAAVLRPESDLQLIQTRDAKREALTRLGLDFFVEHPFTPEFAGTSAHEFVALLKRTFPGLESVFVGENFRFGRAREGDVAVLAAAARTGGFEVRLAPRLADGGQPISSSRLRGLIAAGDFVSANALLGYTHSTRGKVVEGRRLGRTLGFPTLNLRSEPSLRPPLGVYAVRVGEEAATARPAVANYGFRPTLESPTPQPMLEVHLLDDAPAPGYGDTIRVWWLDFLRPERKFESLDALAEQIRNDCQTARVLLDNFSAKEIPLSA